MEERMHKVDLGHGSILVLVLRTNAGNLHLNSYGIPSTRTIADRSSSCIASMTTLNVLGCITPVRLVPRVTRILVKPESAYIINQYSHLDTLLSTCGNLAVRELS